MEAKLYSPVFVDLREGYDDPVEIGQHSAAYYVDEIHAAILKERQPEEAKRGLMEYYGETDSMDKKVRSLFIGVEIIDQRLWAVATLDVSEPLTPQELHTLRDYMTGQYADGWGEGFERREIRVDDAELNVHLWKHGGEFFIDTREQFAGRLGINIPPDILSQKPAESVIISEPDAVKFAEDRQRLTLRADQNWKDYRRAPHNTTPDNLYHIAIQVVSRRDACQFIKDYADFTAEQVSCLLQFAKKSGQEL